MEAIKIKIICGNCYNEMSEALKRLSEERKLREKESGIIICALPDSQFNAIMDKMDECDHSQD